MSNAVLENNTPREVATSSSVERERRFNETLRTVQIISEAAGSELPINAMEDAAFIANEPGIYILKNHMGESDEIMDTNFTLNRKLLSGAADSAHSVIAGELQVDYRGGFVKRVEIAAKCYAKRTPEERFTRAMRELIIMEDLHSQGVLTMEPIALAIAEPGHPTAGEVVLLTRYNPNIVSMDNLPWGRGVDDENNIESAKLAAETLGNFNARMGYMHGDAKIKNVAVVLGEGAGMIDYETSSEINLSDTAECSLAAYIDFSMLIDSLDYKGFLQNDGSQLTRSVVNQLGESYLTAWEDSPDEVQLAVAHQIAEIVSVYDPTGSPAVSAL